MEDQYTLARSDIGQLECRNQPVAVLDILDDVVSAFKARYAEAGLQIVWDQAPDHPATVLGDDVRVRQVFSNLLENSLRYTNAGGRLEIRCEVTNDRVTLHFADTAPGVPDDVLPRLFERYFRVDVSRSRAKGGSGLGLCLCRSFVEAHRGTIGAAASDLGGLAVTVQLPLELGAESV